MQEISLSREAQTAIFKMINQTKGISPKEIAQVTGDSHNTNLQLRKRRHAKPPTEFKKARNNHDVYAEPRNFKSVGTSTWLCIGTSELRLKQTS